MKTKSLFLLVMLLLAGYNAASAQKQKKEKKIKLITVSFKYTFIHAGEGTDINTRLKIYVDGIVKGVSLEKMETEANAVTIEIPAGNHKLRAVIETQYEGGWEEHIIANEYSIDCVYLSDMEFNNHVRVELIFDLEKGTIVKNEQTKPTTFSSPF